MKDEKQSTLAEQAYSAIRTDLIAGRLRPEAKLTFRELVDRYGFSVSPLREALSRLVSESLVDFESQRGFYVAPVSLDDLKDLCSLRIQLETKALHLSIELGGDEWESGVLVSTHRLVRTPRPSWDEDPDAFDRWEMLHDAFHKSLISACGSPWLLRFCHLLSDQYQRYRRLVVSHKAESDHLWNQVRSQHRAIADAVLARDVAVSTDLLTRHFDGSLHQVIELYSGSSPTKRIKRQGLPGDNTPKARTEKLAKNDPPKRPSA